MLVLGLVPSQVSPSRLGVRASVAERHLTYAEFGAWVGRTAGVPVSVAPALTERKMALFVKDRPLGETMRRVAEALFLEWEPSGTGFSLRLQPKVAAEETATLAAARDERETRFRGEIESAIRLARHESDPLERKLRDAEQEAQSAKGAGDAAEEQARIVFERAREDVAARRAFGAVWLALPPERRQALLAGLPVVAQSGEGARTLDLPPDVMEEIRQTFGQDERGPRMIVRPLGDSLGLSFAVGSTYFTVGGPLPSFVVPNGALDRRLKDWGRRLDPAVYTTPLALSDVPPVRRGTGFLSLGDCLADLHRRTGLCMVGDGSRVPIMSAGLPKGRDVGTWLYDLNSGAGNVTGRQTCRARSDGGWLMVRTGRYWDRLAAEPPERAVRALEKAGERPDGPGLDDYAAFAAAMSPEAERWAAYLALDVPLTPIVYTPNAPFLRLWNALTPAQRSAARSPVGLALARTPPRVQARCVAAYAVRLNGFGLPDEPVGVAIGITPLPPDLRLFVGADREDAPEVFRMANPAGWTYPLHVGPRTYDGLIAAFARPGRPADVNFVLPFRPVAER